MVRLRLLLAIVGVLLFAVCYPASRRIEFNRSIAAMFKATDPTFQAYQELQDAFGGNSVVILVYHDQALSTAEGLARNRALSDEVKRIEGVQGVLSPAILNDAIEKLQPASFFSSAPDLFRRGDPVADGFDQLFAGYTHSRDHTLGAVVAILDPGHSPETVVRLGQLADRLTSQQGSPADLLPPVREAVIVGEPVLVHDGFALIERDGARLATLTVALLSIVVVVCLADWRFVALTGIMIFWSVTITKGVMVWLGINLSLVSTILTAIVTVITVTAVLHLGVRFRVARLRGKGRKQSVAAALSLLVVPIFWTCMTDAAGFAALYASRILPIRQFGVMIAIASLAVCFAVAFFAPAVMACPGLRRESDSQRWQRRLARGLHRKCLRLSYGSIRHPAWCVSAMAAALAVMIVGIGRARVETSFLNNFRPGSSVVRAYRGVETQFGGAGVWDVVLDAPTQLTSDYLQQVRRLEAELRAIDVDGARLTKVLSLADAEEIAARAPLSGMLSPSARLSAMYLVMPSFFDALMTRPDSGGRKLRIMLRSREQLESQQKIALIREVERKVHDHVSSDRWKAATGKTGPPRVTGYYVLLARLVSQLLGDQWRCFLVSGLFVWMLLGLATRSLRLATSALLPNLLPIFLVLALVGIFGGKINMGATMIAAVSIGLSIDGSVHFLAGYRRCRDRGHDSLRSAVHAAGTIGVPVLLATLALVVGFGVMSTSDFIPTATFGTLVAATLALGTLVNLTLLPAMVVWADR